MNIVTISDSMNHVELCDLINKLRLEEGNRAELDKTNLLKKIKKEIETLKTLGLNTEVNFYFSAYKDRSGKTNPTYQMNRDAILQIAASESVYVRAKIIEYINALEHRIEMLQRDIVLRTRNYDKFILHEENRTVNKNTEKFKNLKKSMLETGENIIPIIVNELPNGKYLIIDGHNRFLAAKEANAVIRYMVNNEYQLDFDLELQSTCSRGNWTRIEKYERGLKLDIPLCNLIEEYKNKYNNFHLSTIQKIILKYLGNTKIKHYKKYPSEDTFFRKLGTIDGTKQLKFIEIDLRDKKDLDYFIVRFIEFWKDSDIKVNSEHIEMYIKYWNIIDNGWSTIINNWNKVKKHYKDSDLDWNTWKQWSNIQRAIDCSFLEALNFLCSSNIKIN